MVSLGALPTPFLLLIVSLGLATIVGRIVVRVSGAPKAHVFAALFDMLVVGVIAARLVFVLQYLPLYLADPLSIIRPSGGGYSVWAGILAGLLVGAWRALRNETLRRPLAWGTLAGLVAWGMLASSLTLFERAHIRLPDAQLATLDGDLFQLSTLTGRPAVVNIWASWCPPCRREMPVFADAQQAHPEINFVFVNQGEDADVVRSYLQGESLQLQNIVLDLHSEVSHATGARGLPTTLFFDRNGRLIDTHMGELTQPSLAHKLQEIVRGSAF